MTFHHIKYWLIRYDQGCNNLCNQIDKVGLWISDHHPTIIVTTVIAAAGYILAAWNW